MPHLDSAHIYGQDVVDEITYSVFTPDELATIRRFVAIIPDMGVGAQLTMKLCREFPHSASQAIDAMTTALRDVMSSTDSGANPSGLVTAGPSVKLIARWLSNLVPDDFVPTQAIVDKCHDQFYAIIRRSNANTNS